MLLCLLLYPNSTVHHIEEQLALKYFHYYLKYKNVDLGFTQSCGFNAYGNRKKRGVRLIELDEQSPDTYRTYTRTFDEAVGDKLHRPVLDLLSSMAPETTDAAIPLIIRAFTFIGIVALAFILLSLL